VSEVRLEAVAAFSYLHEAEFARTSLESEGIVTVIENENLIRLDWLYMNALGGLRLLVREEDAGRAREILAHPAPAAERTGPVDPADPAEDPAPATESCPRCGSLETEAVETRRKVGHVLWLLTGFPFVRPGRSRRCAACGLPLAEGESLE
jgi:hypothetical protein